MPRACKACGRVVAEAVYCPFCAEPTVEHIPVHIPVHVNRREAMMTIRTEFEQRAHWIAIVSLISSFGSYASLSLQFLFVVSWSYPFFGPLFLIAAFLCLLVALSTGLYGRSLAFPCPRCEKNIDLKVIAQNVRFCPFCGLDLDVEIDPESHPPTELLKKEWGQHRLEIKNTGIQLPPGKQKGNADIQLPPGKEEKGIA